MPTDDTGVLAIAHEWSEREPQLDMFAIPVGAKGRMETIAAIADLGIPVDRETNLVLDHTSESLGWVT